VNHIHVDVAVIGAGSAGLAAYRAAQAHQKRVVLIEVGPYGTTCARVGCMPSKLLIAAAEAAHRVASAAAFGVHAGSVRIDGVAVMQRVRAERDHFVSFVIEGVEQIAAADRLLGHARFTDPHTLQVDDHTTVTAGQIVIATGSRPHTLAQFDELGDRVVTSNEVFDWTDLPESIAVIGAGPIGIEIGQALQRLGVRVAVFGLDHALLGIKDPVVLAAATAALAKELELHLDSSITKAAREGDGVLLHWRDGGGPEQSAQFALVLSATGRVTNTDRLGLESTGLVCDKRGVPQFDSDTMQCGASHIFIAGDASNDRPLLHEAVDAGRIAGNNAGCFPDVQHGLRRVPLAIAFTDPQVASVGTGGAALADGAAASGEVSFDDQGRSRVMLQNQGVLRVYGEHGSQRFCGAEMCGPSAEHLAHLMAWALQCQMTVPQMLEMPFYHPVVEEGLRTALRDLQKKLQKGEIDHCGDCTPGM
jgi:dihydrolipoamide dehydrogenase